MSRMRRVLVVDDERMARAVAAGVGAEFGQVVVADTLRQAWWELNDKHFDVVLLDLTLEDSDLENTVLSIPAILAAGADRVVIMTASPVDDDLKEFARASGADEILSKSAATFLDGLRSALAKPLTK